MYVVLGATGHVGSAVAAELLKAGEAVTVVTRDRDKADAWRSRGASAAMLDIHDSAALRDVFRTARRAFLLNPSADPATDTDAEERRTSAAIIAALEGSGLEKVVAQSAYGAQPGERIGDLSVLYGFEQALAAQAIPVTVMRSAYLMSNWDGMLEAARGGVLPSMLPADLRLPMVAPADLGAAGAQFLREPAAQTGMRHVEGPASYSPDDVAAAFAVALGHPVGVRVTPREEWEAAYRSIGFSSAAAQSYARMTGVSVDGGFEQPAGSWRGQTTLRDYIAEMAAGGQSSPMSTSVSIEPRG